MSTLFLSTVHYGCTLRTKGRSSGGGGVEVGGGVGGDGMGVEQWILLLNRAEPVIETNY